MRLNAIWMNEPFVVYIKVCYCPESARFEVFNWENIFSVTPLCSVVKDLVKEARELF